MRMIIVTLVVVLAQGLFGSASSLAAENSTVCLQCHGAQTGRLGAPVVEWQMSVHAENGIACHDCHGGDPTDMAMAMSPERGFRGAPEYEEVPDFCGRCHVGVKEDYLASKHGQALASGGPQCVVCHENHAVKRASLALINEQDCSRCHDYERAAQIRASMEQIDRQIGSLESELPSLRRVGIAVKGIQGEIFALRNEFHRLFHTVDVAQVKHETERFGVKLGEIGGQIEGISSSLHQRKIWGGVATVLLVLAGLIFWLLRRTYHEQEHDDRSH